MLPLTEHRFQMKINKKKCTLNVNECDVHRASVEFATQLRKRDKKKVNKRILKAFYSDSFNMCTAVFECVVAYKHLVC